MDRDKEGRNEEVDKRIRNVEGKMQVGGRCLGGEEGTDK